MKISEIDSKNIKICGRTNGQLEPLTLVWTGSFVEFNVKAGELKMLIEGPYNSYENWIAIEINGEVVSRRLVEKEKQWVTIFRMRNPQNVTNVKIIKEVQAYPSDSEHRLNIYEIETDGELLPVEDKRCRIEFVGDSVTSAEGAIGAKCEEDWISSLFSHVNSYPYLVGKQLDADVRVFSQSGWGVYSSWDCDGKCAVPKYYEEICSIMEPGYFDKNGYNEPWDFSKWQPDAVVINLGTNDDFAFHNDDCENKNFLRMDGKKYCEEDRLKVRAAMVDFLKVVRKNNPDAFIIWAFGILGYAMEPTIREAIDIYIRETRDIAVKYVRLPELTDDKMGARWHPGRAAHEAMADIIVRELKENVKVVM